MRGRLKLKKRKGLHNLGNNPCGSCQEHYHKTCRPRMDNTLCSCSCERAEAMREEYALALRTDYRGVEQEEVIAECAKLCGINKPKNYWT